MPFLQARHIGAKESAGRFIGICGRKIQPTGASFLAYAVPSAVHNRAAGIKHVAVTSTIFDIPGIAEGVDSLFAFQSGHGLFDIGLEVIPEPRL